VSFTGGAQFAGLSAALCAVLGAASQQLAAAVAGPLKLAALDAPFDWAVLQGSLRVLQASAPSFSGRPPVDRRGEHCPPFAHGLRGLGVGRVEQVAGAWQRGLRELDAHAMATIKPLYPQLFPASAAAAALDDDAPTAAHLALVVGRGALAPPAARDLKALLLGAGCLGPATRDAAALCANARALVLDCATMVSAPAPS
jgi:hypothetical protein